MRTPYEKPKLTRVKLVPEEEVLKGCKKAASKPGPGTKCHPVGGCKKPGPVS